MICELMQELNHQLKLLQSLIEFVEDDQDMMKDTLLTHKK